MYHRALGPRWHTNHFQGISLCHSPTSVAPGCSTDSLIFPPISSLGDDSWLAGWGSCGRWVLSGWGWVGGEILVGPCRDTGNLWVFIEEDVGELSLIKQGVLEALMGRGNKTWYWVWGQDLGYQQVKGVWLGAQGWRKGRVKKRWGKPCRHQSEHQGERKYWNAMY